MIILDSASWGTEFHRRTGRQDLLTLPINTLTHEQFHIFVCDKSTMMGQIYRRKTANKTFDKESRPMRVRFGYGAESYAKIAIRALVTGVASEQK